MLVHENYKQVSVKIMMRVIESADKGLPPKEQYNNSERQCKFLYDD
jgi:hypothetical protein